MSAETFLAQLDGVRKTGPDRWIARCSSHKDKHASLTVRELSDGRTLVHCFAGCSVHEVLAAAGMTMDALFPEKPERAMFNRHHVERQPWNARDVLRALSFETTIVRLCAGVMQKGEALSDSDEARLGLAFSRIVAAETLINAR